MMINEEMKLPSKVDDPLSNEEECIYLRQRYNVLKAVTDKYQEELTSWKQKGQGMDMVIQLMKEAKEENISLQKRIKTLEAALSNYQRKLSNNGLSCSVTPEETELLVPGASKHILDNLAKENLRLRNSEKKYMIDIEELKAEMTKLRSEKSALIIKQDDVSYKGKLNSDQSKDKNGESVLQEQDGCGAKSNDAREESGKEKRVETASVGCQATDSRADKVADFKTLMKSTVLHCTEMLHQSSEVFQALEEDKAVDSNLKTPVLVDEDYQKLMTKLNEANQMNERWLAYSQNLKTSIQTLATSNETLKKSQANATADLMMRHEDIERLKAMLRQKDVEIVQLSRDVSYYKSNDEIYKQQIQVCTEDFNTERKDRQQAVSKAKGLQDELTKCKAEIDRLKLLNNSELINRYQHNTPLARRYELVQERGPSPSQASQPRDQSPHLRQGQSPTLHSISTAGHAPHLPLTPMPLGAVSEASSLPHRIPFTDYNSMRYRRNIVSDGVPTTHPQPALTELDPPLPLPHHQQMMSEPRLAYVNVPGDEVELGLAAGVRDKSAAASMPVLARKRNSLPQDSSYSVCPKCNKEFPDTSQPELMAHIDLCNA